MTSPPHVRLHADVPSHRRVSRRRRRARALLAGALTVLIAGLLLPRLAAYATVPEPTTSPVVGNSTYFDGLGSPYGGCGLPQSVLETQDFVALNVYDTPGDYAFYPRPLPPDQANRMGIWNNGHNCGRWVQVTVDDYCTGVNDGAPGQAFCRNGSWVRDSFNGAVLNMLVADSCGDANAWCRDDPYHLDLAKASLDRFTRGGAPVGSLLPNNFNNRRMSWRFIPAPNYAGDIQLGFLAGAQRWWPAIAVSRLANGVHAVEHFTDGSWRAAPMNGDMGQSFIIDGTTAGADTFRIRVRDVDDQLINGGRVYEFALPASCANQCGPAYTRVDYTTSGGTDPTAPVTTPPVTTPPTTPPATTPPPTTPPATTPPATDAACAATYRVTGSWTGGFQAEVAVRNSGATALRGWRVGWTLPSGQTVNQVWNGAHTVTAGVVTVTNVAYNGALSPANSTTFGLLGSFTGTGAPAVPTAVTCQPVT